MFDVAIISRLARTNAPRWPIPDTKIDKLRNHSYAGLVNLQVSPELETKLARLAAETGRTVDQVALEWAIERPEPETYRTASRRRARR